MKKIALIRYNDPFNTAVRHIEREEAEELVAEKRAKWIIRHNGYNPFTQLRLTLDGEAHMQRIARLRDQSCSPGPAMVHAYAEGREDAKDVINWGWKPVGPVREVAYA